MGRLTESNFFDLVHDFIKIYLPNQKNVSPCTVEAYKSALNNYLDFICNRNNVELKTLTFNIFEEKYTEDFCDWMKREKKYSATSINQKVAGIKVFLNYVAIRKPEMIKYYTSFSKIPRQKIDAWASVNYMTEGAVNAILRQPDVKKREGLRDFFYMVMIYDTAARVNEMSQLRICDVRIGSTSTVILNGKGSKVRTVPIMNRTVEYYKKYMEVFHKGESQLSTKPLFFTKRKDIIVPMSDDNVRKFMTRYANQARKECVEVPEKVYPHLWRHSRAMHLYQHGMDLTLISQWLGHSNLNVTLVYAHADTEKKRDAINKAMENSSFTIPDTSLYKISDEELLKKLCGLK